MSAATAVERAQAALDKAQAAHDAEQAAQAQQDHATATAYWQHVHTEVLPGRVQAMQAARQAFTEAVHDATDPAGAYAAYVAAHARWQATSNAVAKGLQTFVNDLTGEPHADPSERWGRAVYPPGVSLPSTAAPDTFQSMLDAAVKAAHTAHTRATAADLRAGLEAHQ
jgi:hypothetical protein